MLIKNILFSSPRKIIPSVFSKCLRNALIASSMLSVSLYASAEVWDEMDLYVGAGIGQSDLSPYHVENQGFSIDDDWQQAWKITGGLDVNDYLSVEGYYSDLGNIGLTPSASVGYRMAGADVILHYWAKGEERMQGSIALYAKVGANETDAYSTGNVAENDDLRMIFGGLGAELYLPQKFSVRFEFESYNADASLFSLNLVKRFGFKSKKVAQKEFVAMVQTLPETASGPSIVVLDSDLDGLLDDDDQCPYTPKGMSVDNVGCATFIGEVSDLIANVQFETNSSSLTEAGKVALNEIADMLVSYAAIDIEVQAHSDNTGSSAYNQILSQKRAASVVKYLDEKSIVQSRLTSLGFGEENPIADNNTSEGRAKNRRVEFKLKQR
ncbi:MAG: outer membrane protein OmpA-like peptidoglycan-associated protein [Moritella dasanensis]|jgi:outer membrane protein OmpA-like peptidoglycan-associated protein